MRTRTMVVARDTDLRAYLARLLHRGGYSVDLAESAEHARRIGFGNCKVALVAPDGLGDGADDLLAELQAIAKTLLISPSLYPLGPVPAGVIDPSNDDSLLTRVADALRPSRDAATALMLHFADWRLDVAGHSLFDREGTEIPLTRGEFNVLRAFLQRPGHVLSREHLLHTLSGREAEPYDRAIDMFIVRLRRKIEPDPKRPTLIRTVPGAGYKFTAAVRRTTADVTEDRLSVQSTSEPSTNAGSAISNDELSPQADGFRLGEFRLDRRRGLARKHANGGWQPIALEAGLSDILFALVERQGEVVTRQALTEAGWSGNSAGSDNATAQIDALNRILDVGGGGRIETFDDRGYRFVRAMARPGSIDDADGPLRVRQTPAFASRSRLSVVVMPAKDRGNDAEANHHAELILDQFTAQLSLFPGAFVISATTDGLRDGPAKNVRDVGERFGVNYVIQANVRRAGDRAIASLQLIDATTGRHLWAEHLEMNPADSMEIRDEIVGRSIRSVSLKLIAEVNRSIEALPKHEWTSLDLVMRGRAIALRPLSAMNRHDALECYERALDMDPESVWARLGICLMLIGNLVDGGSLSVDRDETRVEQLLLSVLRDEANIPEVHTYLGMLRRFQGRLEDSRAALEIAIGLNPNNVLATTQLGLTLAYEGQPEAAILRLQRCLRLAPHDPTTPATYARLGLCHLFLGHFDEATECLRNARTINPQLHYVHHLLAAALALRGDLDAARDSLQHALAIRHDIGSRSALGELLRQGSPRFLELYRTSVYAGLLEAGLPAVAVDFAPFPDDCLASITPEAAGPVAGAHTGHAGNPARRRAPSSSSLARASVTSSCNST